MTFQITNGRAFAPGVFFAGLQSVSVPFFGGDLLVFPGGSSADPLGWLVAASALSFQSIAILVLTMLAATSARFTPAHGTVS